MAKRRGALSCRFMTRRAAVQEFSRMLATRIVAQPDALDGIAGADDLILMRVAADELLIFPPQDVTISDEFAIIIEDGSFSGGWFAMEEALDFLLYNTEWELPAARPAYAQGNVAGIATKLHFLEDRVLIIVPAPYAQEMEDRMSH
jgi:hypothetical protein